MNGKTLYFAYGSNLAKRDMGIRAPGADPAGRATLSGWRLVFRGVADIEPAEGRVVEGGLWWVDPDGIRALDRYEGAPSFYEQVSVEVVTPSGITVEAMTYVMTDRRAEGEVGLPSKGYFDTIARGYRDFRIPVKTLGEALKFSRKRHDALGVLFYRPRGDKRLMAILPEPEPAAVMDLGEIEDEDFWSGMSPATRREWELEREWEDRIA